MLKQIGSSLSVKFIQKILGKDSPLRSLRLSPHNAVWQTTLGVYHAVLSLKNVPLLQEAYNYILADLQVSIIPLLFRFMWHASLHLGKRMELKHIFSLWVKIKIYIHMFVVGYGSPDNREEEI